MYMCVGAHVHADVMKYGGELGFSNVSVYHTLDVFVHDCGNELV